MEIQVYGGASVKSELNEIDSKFIVWQVKIWDWFARAVPFIIAVSSVISYFIGFRDWNFLYSVCAIFFVCVAVTWWFWVIYTIATIAIVIDNSGRSLKEVIKEIKEIKKSINEKKDNLNR